MIINDNDNDDNTDTNTNNNDNKRVVVYSMYMIIISSYYNLNNN